MMLGSTVGHHLSAQEAPIPKPLAELSLEELGNIDITSVSKRPERLSKAPAAVYVITQEDIRRSGTTTLPEVLRLAPNLQVNQVDSSLYALGARGLTTGNVNNLLVLIDGRTVYSPLHSGVFWDAQDTLLADIDRIEVISGPGGTLWGSNAVNGVINILTRNAKDTQGTLVTASVGNEDRFLANARHGGKLSDNASYRIYAKYMERDAAIRPNGDSSSDGWHRAQGGFRVDWADGMDTATFQGDGYAAVTDQLTLTDKRIDGANLLGRWGRSWSPDSDLKVQVYLDRTHRDQPTVFAETVNTFDLDVQYRFKPSNRHEVVLGGGYRSSRDNVTNTPLLSFLPPKKELRLANIFAQDSIALIKNELTLTLGAKLEHNVYTGWEVQPSGRLAWQVEPHHLLWMAISRAVRTPSRLDRDFYVDLPPILTLNGGPDFQSETLVSYELGYRGQLSPRFALSLSPFYNVYKDLRSLERFPGTNSYTLGNGIEGKTYGSELWSDVLLTDAWRLKLAYTYLRTSFHIVPGSTDTSGGSSTGNDARHRFQLTSLLTIAPHIEIDWTLRHVSSLPNPVVPAYWALNIRLGWRPSQHLEISLIGQNLLDKRHPEFGSLSSRNEIEQGVLAKAVWTF
jgi:iron complex outermembrane receptor protein